MPQRDDKEFAKAWFSVGRTADFVCETCGASPIDFPEKCNVALDVACPGFLAIGRARAEFETHWERRSK